VGDHVPVLPAKRTVPDAVGRRPVAVGLRSTVTVVLCGVAVALGEIRGAPGEIGDSGRPGTDDVQVKGR
jgi:hypothetical protein